VLERLVMQTTTIGNRIMTLSEYLEQCDASGDSGKVLEWCAERAKQLENKVDVMTEALKRIEKWHGEFPVTGKFWDEEKTRPTSFASEYGSNGERDYMRSVASAALDV